MYIHLYKPRAHIACMTKLQNKLVNWHPFNKYTWLKVYWL
jgi:hypothetical protein